MAQEGFLNRIVEVFIDVFAWEDGKAFSLTRFSRGALALWALWALWALAFSTSWPLAFSTSWPLLCS